MIDWASLAFKMVTAVAGATQQGLENQGQKIPMKEEATLAKAHYRAEKFKWETDIKVFEAKQIRKWKADFMINANKFSLIQEGAAKNMIERLVKSGKIIFRIDISHDREERCWAYIRYVDDDECETFVKMQGKRG